MRFREGSWCPEAPVARPGRNRRGLVPPLARGEAKLQRLVPREAVAAPSLSVFQARLDGALSSLVWRKVPLLMAGGLEPDEL